MKKFRIDLVGAMGYYEKIFVTNFSYHFIYTFRSCLYMLQPVLYKQRVIT